MRRDTFFWFDPSVHSKPNQNYLSKLRRRGIRIEGFASMPGLQDAIAKLPPKKKVKVISAASHFKQYFSKLLNEPRIAAIFLFCQNRDRAEALMKEFPSIRKTAFTIEELIEMLKEE